MENDWTKRFSTKKPIEWTRTWTWKHIKPFKIIRVCIGKKPRMDQQSNSDITASHHS